MRRAKLGPPAIAASVLLVTMGLAACGGGGGSAKFDLKIGDIVPLTGDLAPYGPPGRKAADLAIDQIHKAITADKLDETVTIKHEDEETLPAPAVSAARKLVDGGTSCIAGAWASADTIPVARSVTIRDKVLQLSPASTSSLITPIKDDNLLNRTAPGDNLQGIALAAAMEKELGGAAGKTVNIGARNDAYGTGLAGYFEASWKKRGGKVGQKVIYDPAQPSYDSEAAKITSGNPDAFVIVDFPKTFKKVGPALVRTGKWDPKKTFITDGLADSTLPATVGAAVTEGLRGTAPGTPTKGSASVAFDRLFTSSPPRSVKRQTFDGQNFDAVILCYLAAVAADSAKGEDMAKKLRDVTGPPGTQYTWVQLPAAAKALKDGKDIDYEGVAGPLDLDQHGDPTAGVYTVLQFKAGKLVPIRQVPLPEA